jgi:hypothetical protein
VVSKAQIELLSSYERAQEKRLFEVYIFNALFSSESGLLTILVRGNDPSVLLKKLLARVHLQ